MKMLIESKMCTATRHGLFTGIIFSTSFLITLFSCNVEKNEKKFTVGFSQCTINDVWRQYMQKEMERELSFHPEIKFEFKYANLNPEKQTQQIQEFVDQKVDLIIASPSEAEPVRPVIEKAYSSGIPVILVDRNILSDKYSANIGTSNYKLGQSAGAYANAVLKGKGSVIEIGGPDQGSSADIGRHNGFKDFIKQCPGIKYEVKLSQDWDKAPAKAEEELTGVLLAYGEVQLIFAQNDRIGFGAYRVCKKLGIEKRVSIIGIDGLPGENGGIDLVDKGILKATILYPTGGKEAIQTAANILEGRPYQRQQELATTIIDSTNVRIMKLQNDRLTALQSDIDRSQKRIEAQAVITDNQTNIIYAISISLALALILGSISYYYLRENKKINVRLARKNEQILLQRDQLIELEKKAREAAEARTNFFTNISHEFRTPLTLILSPLEEMIANQKIHFTEKQHLALIRKNVIRLLRLVNQLIDFRKIEADKMQIKASENDLVLFINEIVQSFKDTAKKRNIDLRVLTGERNIPLWFDVSLLDKVIFNLLSNAFKFTKDNGFIYITLDKRSADGYAVIKVEDNGIGMSEQVAAHVFELFYQADVHDQRGSGMGLSLSKQLIELHHGEIKVDSKEGKGTLFTIKLPLGTSHLAENEIWQTVQHEDVLYHDEKIYSGELVPVETTTYAAMAEPKSEYNILIIEDNTDLLGYLAQTLGKEYSILPADNGITGIQLAFDNVPDLIISDIMLPGKDGIAVTAVLKNDIRTSHIPIILLTARQAIEKQIEGMQSRADAYIVKPFNQKFLEETIRSLMKNREILREHYTSEFSSELKSHNPKKLDRKFINEFTSLVEANISNENFSIDEICNTIGISRVQLYRKIKALLGVNVNDYILNVRMQKAKHYLGTGEFSIAETAFKVGFSSASYFSTVFKSKYGMTPKEYKEK